MNYHKPDRPALPFASAFGPREVRSGPWGATTTFLETPPSRTICLSSIIAPTCVYPPGGREAHVRSWSPLQLRRAPFIGHPVSPIICYQPPSCQTQRRPTIPHFATARLRRNREMVGAPQCIVPDASGTYQFTSGVQGHRRDGISDGPGRGIEKVGMPRAPLTKCARGPTASPSRSVNCLPAAVEEDRGVRPRRLRLSPSCHGAMYTGPGRPMRPATSASDKARL